MRQENLGLGKWKLVGKLCWLGVFGGSENLLLKPNPTIYKE